MTHSKSLPPPHGRSTLFWDIMQRRPCHHVTTQHPLTARDALFTRSACYFSLAANLIVYDHVCWHDSCSALHCHKLGRNFMFVGVVVKCKDVSWRRVEKAEHNEYIRAADGQEFALFISSIHLAICNNELPSTGRGAFIIIRIPCQGVCGCVSTIGMFFSE